MYINYRTKIEMVHFCSVPGCSNHSDRETQQGCISVYILLKRKKLVKIWVHKIGRKNLPINCTRVCSNHFVNVIGCLLGPDEYLSINIPASSITTSQAKP